MKKKKYKKLKDYEINNIETKIIKGKINNHKKVKRRKTTSRKIRRR